jgi:hypothetical protein
MLAQKKYKLLKFARPAQKRTEASWCGGAWLRCGLLRKAVQEHRLFYSNRCTGSVRSPHSGQMHLHTAYIVALAMVITQNLCHAGRQEAGALLVLTERLGLPDGDGERRRVTSLRRVWGENASFY